MSPTCPALAHGVEVRANCMALQVEIEQDSGRARGVVYATESDGVRRLQRAQYVSVSGYSIETPRLLLASVSRRFPHGLGNDTDQVGRYVMVQGATQSAGRWPHELRMYKAPPPEISSEQFYETDPDRGFARGFSIQTVSPLPIGWAEPVLADGHWGRALRGPEPVPRRRIGVSHSGQRQPGSDHHGSGLPAGTADGQRHRDGR